MVNIRATSSILKKDIQAALTELGRDREVFERAEINPDAIQRSIEKYGQLIPTALFDFWYDRHQSLQRRVEELENQEKEFLESVQGYFKTCIEASSIAGQRLTEIVKKHSCFSANQVRADLDLLDQTVKIMVLLKGNWPETEGPSEEAMNQLHCIESDFFDLENKFVHSYPFPLLGSANPIQIRIEAHWLLIDSRLDADSLTEDYPVSVRC
ncbi:MAG: hypothetical protein LBQ87_09815 [Candidatus Fibromonas sp.]|jgi:hypothetical protein|nr:hypothetical protein [Candidatus Fibromonas sp.]